MKKDSQLPISRRDLLSRIGAGIGTLGLAGVMQQTGLIKSAAAESLRDSSIAPRSPHFAPKAKRVIQLFMPGGPSQVDTFDYKPEIKKHEGKRPALVDKKSLRNTKNGLMPSPFGFNQYG